MEHIENMTINMAIRSFINQYTTTFPALTTILDGFALFSMQIHVIDMSNGDFEVSFMSMFVFQNLDFDLGTSLGQGQG